MILTIEQGSSGFLQLPALPTLVNRVLKLDDVSWLEVEPSKLTQEFKIDSHVIVQGQQLSRHSLSFQELKVADRLVISASTLVKVGE